MTRQPSRPPARLAASLVVAALLVAGCGSDASPSAAADRGSAGGPAAPAEPGTRGTGGDLAAAPETGAATGPSSAQGRVTPPGTLARTGALTVAVEDVVGSAEQAGGSPATPAAPSSPSSGTTSETVL